MTRFSFKSAPELISSINTLVARCEAQNNETLAYYGGMRVEVEQSVEESRQSIEANLVERQCKRDAGLEQALAKCREYARYIKELNDSARNGSKAYQKTCAEAECLDIQQPQYSIETLGHCQEKLHELSEQAKQSYGQIANTGGISTLIDAVSGELKRNHTTLIDAYKSSKDVLRRAETIVADVKRVETESDKVSAEREVEAAVTEGAELLIQIEQKERADIETDQAILRKQLNELFPSTTIADLTELSELAAPAEGSIPCGLCQQLYLGSYSYAIQGWPFSAELSGIEQALEDQFGAWYRSGCIRVPALLDRAETSSVVLCGYAEATSPALNWLAASELEANQAPGQAFIFINPSGDRKVFEPFLAAIKECHEVFGERVITDADSASDALKKAVSVIDDRNQRLLIGYKDVFEFNEDDNTAELPLITICMSANLRDIDKRDAEAIKSIVRNGSFCGVNILLALDVEASSIDEATDFLADCSEAVIGWPSKSEHAIDIGKGVEIRYEYVDRQRLASDLSRVKEQVKDRLAQSVDIESVSPATSWHEGSTLRGLAIPMGKSPDGNPVSLEFGPEVGNGISHFGLMIGATGSGKSSLLHSLIISSLLKYGPDELQLYLLDFKSGVEFELYSKYKIPQLKLLALDAMQAFGLSVLKELMQQMDERNRLFKGAGVGNIEEYRTTTGYAMPRILVLMDEFQTLFNEDHDRRAARESSVLLADFISLARNCGIHFLLSTQTLSRIRTGNFSINQSTLDEMHVRIGLQCSASETEKLFGDIFGKQAYDLMGSQKGSGVLTENDLKLPPCAFRAVFCDKEKRAELLEMIEDRYSAINPIEGTRIFRSDTVPDIRDGMSCRAGSPANTAKGIPIFLGEPIRIGSPIVLNVNRRMRSTLLIAGGDARMLDSLVANYVFSAFSVQDCQGSEDETSYLKHPTVYLCEGRAISGDSGSELLSRVCAGRHEDVRVAKSNMDVIRFLDELYRIMIERQSSEDSSYQTIHFVISEYQWMDAFLAIFERRDSQYDEEAGGKLIENDPDAMLDEILSSLSRPASGEDVRRIEKLERLIQRGYAYGINVVVGTTDFVFLRERLYDLVPNMQNRIVFSLSEDDAERIVHGALGQMETLRSNMAIITDGRSEPEIFKPYRISTI